MSFHNRSHQSEIVYGLKIDDPLVFIPWEADSNSVKSIFHNEPLLHITEDYYVIKGVRLFGTLKCNIGFHFNNTLRRIELFRESYENLYESFRDFQIRLEFQFGQPNKREKTFNDFEDCTWLIQGKIEIHHYIIDRFGFEEHLYFKAVY